MQRDFQHLDDDEENHFILAARNIGPQSLSTLFRKSPELAALNLEMCTLPTVDLVCALAFAPDSLTTLCIGGTAAVESDDLIDRLHTLVPNLTWLDVFSPDGEENGVSLPALARLANRLKQKRRLLDWIAAFHFTIVTRKSHRVTWSVQPSVTDLPVLGPQTSRTPTSENPSLTYGTGSVRSCSRSRRPRFRTFPRSYWSISRRTRLRLKRFSKRSWISLSCPHKLRSMVSPRTRTVAGRHFRSRLRRVLPVRSRFLKRRAR